MTIYLAADAFRYIDLDEIAKETERKRIEKANEAARQKVREDQKRRAIARKVQHQKIEEERIKKQTLAPLPPVEDRREDIDLSKYEFAHSGSCVYRTADITTNEFLNDSKVSDFVRIYKVDLGEFKKKYYHLIISADCLWAWIHEQMHSLALEPKAIMEELIVVFGVPAALGHVHESKYDYKFMKYYFREWRKDWCKVKYDKDSCEIKSAVDKLWCYFRYWYCDARIGAMLHHRATLVQDQFQFASKPADTANHEPNYHSVDFLTMEADLIKLHKHEKEIIAAMQKNNELKYGNSKAGHKRNEYNEEKKHTETPGNNHSFKATEKDNNRDELAGGNKKECELDKLIATVKRKLQQKYNIPSSGNLTSIKAKDNDKLHEKKIEKQAGGSKTEYKANDEYNNFIMKNDNNKKEVKAGANQNDKIDPYDYSAEEEEQKEEQEDEEEWDNIAHHPSADDDEDDDDDDNDMSISADQEAYFSVI